MRFSLGDSGRTVVVVFLTCLLVSGCGRPKVYGMLGVSSTGESWLLNCFLGIYTEDAQGEEHLQHMIMWQAHMAGRAWTSRYGRTVRIHGERIKLPPERGVFALRRNHSIERIKISSEEADRLFRIARTMEGKFHHDPVWNEKVAPHLSIVEPPPRPERTTP